MTESTTPGQMAEILRLDAMIRNCNRLLTGPLGNVPPFVDATKRSIATYKAARLHLIDQLAAAQPQEREE